MQQCMLQFLFASAYSQLSVVGDCSGDFLLVGYRCFAGDSSAPFSPIPADFAGRVVSNFSISSMRRTWCNSSFTYGFELPPRSRNDYDDDLIGCSIWGCCVMVEGMSDVTTAA